MKKVDLAQRLGGAEMGKWMPSEATEFMMHAAQDVPEPRTYGAVYRAMYLTSPKQSERIYTINGEFDSPFKYIAYLHGQLAELAEANERRREHVETVSLDDLAALLPGPYYMDPPDGGSVHVMEQLRRMSEDAAKFRAIDRLAPLSPDGWKPIETAPKDGSEILLRSARGRIASGNYGQPDGWANPLCWVWPYVNLEPTHWMPLLPSPQVEESEGGNAA